MLEEAPRSHRRWTKRGRPWGYSVGSPGAVALALDTPAATKRVTTMQLPPPQACGGLQDSWGTAAALGCGFGGASLGTGCAISEQADLHQYPLCFVHQQPEPPQQPHTRHILGKEPQPAGWYSNPTIRKDFKTVPKSYCCPIKGHPEALSGHFLILWKCILKRIINLLSAEIHMVNGT